MGIWRKICKLLFGKRNKIAKTKRPRKTRYDRDIENISKLLDIQPPVFKSYKLHLKESLQDPNKIRKKPLAITFQFVPSSQSNRNVRSYLEFTTGSYKTWQAIRNKCEKDAGGVCEICGETSLKDGVKHLTECHEVWSYDEETRIQKLDYLIALCVRCHRIVHLNQNKAVEADWKILLKDFEYLNNLAPDKAQKYYDKSLSRQKRQSATKFLIDLSFIQGPSNFDPHSKEFEEFLIKFKEKD